MELKFTGRGAMLYPNEGNTAAFFVEDENFFLIDCGEDVASKLISHNELTKDREYYLWITHTHSDHVGSLGTLQQYLFWNCGKKLNIVVSDLPHFELVQSLLNVFGIVPGTYRLVNERELDNRFQTFQSIRYVESSHGDVPIPSSSIVFQTPNGSVLYTGDIADTKVIEKFMAEHPIIDKMYVDTSYQDNPVHLSIDTLAKAVPKELWDKVYCMHINHSGLVDKINGYGFHLVDSIQDSTHYQKVKK